MIKISVIILADNKEEIVENCLKSVNWIGEKILVDLGSKDNTLTIAKKYGCRIIKGSPDYNFSKWRNQGAKAAIGEWLLYVDADERVTPKLQEEILSIIHPAYAKASAGRHPSSIINGYYIPRKNYFWGKEFKSSWPDYQLRLIKKNELIGWQGKIHEVPQVKENTEKLSNFLIHLSHRNLESSLANTINWSKLEAENRFKQNHPVMNSWRFLRILFTGFWEQFIKKQIWKEGTEGVIEGIYQMFSLFFTYFRLWELQKKEKLDQSYKNIDKSI